MKNRNQIIKYGQLLLIKEDNIPPTQWAMGRVIETHPAKDNIIHVCGDFKNCQ